MEPRRINFLDSMRGFAALWVVIYHFNVKLPFPSNAYQSFVLAGNLGVSVFFVLSGYAVHSSLLRESRVGIFLWRRFFRIYPPYLASIAVVLVAIILRRLTYGANDLIQLPHGPLDWLKTLTLATTPVTALPPINWVYWTLSYEAAFYLWLSLLLLAPRTRLIILFGPVLISLFWHSAPIFFIDQWCLFGLGLAIAEWRKQQGWQPALLASTCIVDLLVHRATGETVAGLASFTLICMAFSKPFDWLNREPLFRHAGDWSYSLYLTHVPIGVWIGFNLSSLPRNLTTRGFAQHVAVDMCVTAFCCLFAYGFWRIIEKRSHEYARRNLPKSFAGRKRAIDPAAMSIATVEERAA